MRFLVIMAACALGAEDARAIVEKSLRRDQRDDDLARQYAYLETSAQQEWKNGLRTKLEVETHEIMSLCERFPVLRNQPPVRLPVEADRKSVV